MITKEEIIFINQLAQNYFPFEKGNVWFKNMNSEKQLEILREISNYALQAGVKESDVDAAIKKAELKKTFTPCVLIQKGNLKFQFSKILNLPQEENTKTFALFLSLFSIADERRRNEKCRNGCSHWWHANLSNHEHD